MAAKLFSATVARDHTMPSVSAKTRAKQLSNLGTGIVPNTPAPGVIRRQRRQATCSTLAAGVLMLIAKIA
jgi:hypothetical protein